MQNFRNRTGIIVPVLKKRKGTGMALSQYYGTGTDPEERGGGVEQV